jgi:ABC-type sugar transport system substrate-binding protein
VRIRALMTLAASAMLAVMSASAFAQGTGKLEGDGAELVMFTITSSNIYGANQISGAKAEAERLGYKLTVLENSFSQPEQDQQVQ